MSQLLIDFSPRAAAHRRIGGRRVVVSVSGGKDSAATSLYLTELGIPHDRVFADTGWEHPLTYEYLRGTKPGARYAVVRFGEAYEGRWVPDDEDIRVIGWTDLFTPAEARLLLPLLRVRGSAGRTSREATTPDGKLVTRAKRDLGLTAAGLADAIGAHESALSRALHGSLSDAHREAIRALLNARKPKRPRTR